ncbi:AraC family transcriptional regulator [Halalkalibacter hemicellulosilyticus]|uniref:Transcriptional regulator n=1 Tax=Halalkalibacter hemicellulosilyticusJCM 9152 TaxID=1236971 RepID=W4QBH3_9BACI|nr:AraC family transcriptional regulator [Halalkalibacter hemicellulosilyticus]GAE29365.1 transcriptional regulator [Halalkalibacter hemicellulosilyticusJCM 9152]
MDSGSLRTVIERFTKKDGIHATRIPALSFIRESKKSEVIHSVYAPSLCIVAQGSKVVRLGERSYLYNPINYLVASVHLPITGQVVEASTNSPYVSLQLQFDMDQILDVIQASDQMAKPKRESPQGLVISRMNDSLHDAILRLVQLLDEPDDIQVLTPYVIREIIYRILQNEQGEIIKQFALIGSHAQRISKVIKRLNLDFAQPLRIEELAEEAHMSESSLYYYFKKVTAHSPIQYQKKLRLQEARRLLLSTTIDAADAAFQVGYESPSHFSREYARMFGYPPIKDVRRFRNSLYTN